MVTVSEGGLCGGSDYSSIVVKAFVSFAVVSHFPMIRPSFVKKSSVNLKHSKTSPGILGLGLGRLNNRPRSTAENKKSSPKEE
jgi:hypothetical protein